MALESAPADAAENSSSKKLRSLILTFTPEEEGDNGCDAPAKYAQMTKLLLYNTEGKANTGFSTRKQKWTSATKQNHFRI